MPPQASHTVAEPGFGVRGRGQKQGLDPCSRPEVASRGGHRMVGVPLPSWKENGNMTSSEELW